MVRTHPTQNRYHPAVSRYWWIGLLLVAAVGIGVGLDRAVASGQEVATVALSIPILAIATLTLWFTIPRPAQIRVDRLAEGEFTDLNFYIYTVPNQEDLVRQPGDYLLQLQVAVSNLGQRKAILSAIRLEGFRNDRGDVVHLPDAPGTIGGTRWLQQSGWINNQLHFQNISDPPPYVLDRDDVIVIRFRIRRGIDWTDRWNLKSLRTFSEPLQYPIVEAFGTVIWRRASEVITNQFVVSMKVEAQAPYVQLIYELTQGFTVAPALPERPFTLE